MGSGRTNRKKLLEFLKELPEENFDYNIYFNRNGCNTTGCVAGWCVEQFASGMFCNYADFAKRFLKLSEAEAKFLFYYRCGNAKREDAIKRLQWLVDHGNFDEYPVHEESWYETVREE